MKKGPTTSQVRPGFEEVGMWLKKKHEELKITPWPHDHTDTPEFYQNPYTRKDLEKYY